jgi:hypothetical protein
LKVKHLSIFDTSQHTPVHKRDTFKMSFTGMCLTKKT